MADHSSSKSNQQSAEHKGGPSVVEHEKGAGNLPVNERDEQTEESLETDALDAGTTHPNRNHNKPDIGKASYA